MWGAIVNFILYTPHMRKYIFGAGFAVGLGLMYLHGAAPLMLACVYVAALFQTVAARPARATLLRWLAVRAGVALLATPAIARALAAGSRDASGFSYTVAPGASEVLESLARLLLGPVVGTQPAAVALAAALLGVLAVLGILNARLRPLAAGYLLARSFGLQTVFVISGGFLLAATAMLLRMPPKAPSSAPAQSSESGPISQS